MSSGGKGGGGANQSHDYYGTVLGVGGIGPLLSINSILLNGSQVWGIFNDGGVTSGAALVYNGTSVGNGYQLNVPGLGMIEIWWGTQTTASAALNSFGDTHPPYKGYWYIVLLNCKFGTEQEQPPNLEFFVTTAADQAIVTGASATVDANGNCNAVAIAAELASSWQGLGLPSSAINVASFQTVADAIRTDSFLSQLAGMSPLWKQQSDARTLFADTQCLCDLWFRFDLAGKLECGYWPRTGPAGSVTVITANEWETPPKDAPSDLTAIPTSFDVTFTDSANLDQTTSAPTNNPMAISLGAIGKRQQLQREMITTLTQAHVYGGEALRLLGQPTVTGSVAVRRSQAKNPDGTPIRPGDYFELDTQQTPGGAGVLQLCRCTGRSFDPTGPIILEYEFDPGVSPIPYVVPFSNNTPTTNIVPPLYYQRTGLLPTAPGDTPAVFCLALRHQPLWTGVQVWYDHDPATDFTMLGSQIGFALPCSIQAPIALGDGDNTHQIKLRVVPSFGTGVPGNLDEAYLSNAVGVDSDSASRNNALLCVLVKKDAATGAQIMTGALPYLEICSVVETALNPATVTITSTGGVATVTDTAHGLNTGRTVTISGAAQAAYNGVQTITVVDANHYTFPVSGSPASPATGTILAAYGQYSLTVLRGRMGTTPLAFDTTGGISFPDGFFHYEAWIIPQSLLVGFKHVDFAELAASGGTGWFEFAPFTKRDIYDPAVAYPAVQSSPGWQPLWAYTFPSGYTHAPVITVTAPTGIPVTSTAGAITLSFSVVDPTNTIAEITVFSSRSTDGAGYTVLLDQKFTNAGSFSYSGTITLPAYEGAHILTIQVANSYGVDATETLSIYRAVPSSAFALAVPTSSAPSHPINGFLPVVLTAPAGSSGTAQIEYSVDGGSTWTLGTAGASTLTVTIYPGTVLQFRMTDTGPVYSAITSLSFPNNITGAGNFTA